MFELEVIPPFFVLCPFLILIPSHILVFLGGLTSMILSNSFSVFLSGVVFGLFMYHLLVKRIVSNPKLIRFKRVFDGKNKR